MRIGVLVFPGVQMLEVSGPLDVLSEAAMQSGRPDAYQFELIALEPGPVRASNGMLIQSGSTLDTAPRDIDTLLVPGGPRVHELENDLRLRHWLVREADVVRRLASICSGALLLAAAGLLDGRRVTTHWATSAGLAQRFPKARVEQDRIHTRDGSIYTSAGVSAGMDLALALVEEDMGSEIALQVARRLLMYLKRPGGQSQFSGQLTMQAARSTMQAVQEWALHNLEKDLSLERLAQQAGMHLRSFSRQFKADTGITPATFVESARVDAARRLLEESATPLTRIAARCGFSDPQGMRRAFMRCLGVTPAAYRSNFHMI